MVAFASWMTASSLTPARRRAIRDGLIASGLIVNVVFLVFWTSRFAWFVDAPSWRSINLADLYGTAEQSLTATGAFRMAPIAAWLMYPLALVPWEVFLPVFLSLNLAAVAILGRRWTLVLVAAFPPVLLELANGNVHLFMAVAIWAGMRWPPAWSVLLLSKVTPGVGVVWFAARREWRNLAVALGATAAVVAVGFVIAPGQWLEWFRSLLISAQQPQVGTLPPLLLRLPAAAALVWYAARTDRAWLVPFACVLAMPTIWLQSTALLTAAFPLYWERARWQRRAGTAPAAGSELWDGHPGNRAADALPDNEGVE